MTPAPGYSSSGVFGKGIEVLSRSRIHSVKGRGSRGEGAQGEETQNQRRGKYKRSAASGWKKRPLGETILKERAARSTSSVASPGITKTNRREFTSVGFTDERGQWRGAPDIQRRK